MGLAVVQLVFDGQIGFDAQRWNDVWLDGEYNLRYRMHQDVLTKLRRQPRLDRESVLEMLGVADHSNPNQTMLRYDLGSRRILGLPMGRYYLRVLFDDEGDFVLADVHPD